MEPGSAEVRTTIDELWAAVEPLPYPARMRAVADWARREAGAAGDSPRMGLLLRELDARGPYGRRLAGMAAAVAGDIGFLEARLADDDPAVRVQAVKSALRQPIGDAALERATHDAPAAVRRTIAGVVVAGRRTALADRLLPAIREVWGDEEAARLLPGCGPHTVRLLLPELFQAVTRWRVLGRRHPDLLLDEIARQLADLPEQSRSAWWTRNADVFAATAPTRPERVLDLLEAHCPAVLPGPVRGIVGDLLRAAPGRTIRLLTAPGRSAAPARGVASRRALGRLARHDPPELLDLGRAWSHRPEGLVPLLRALPPSRRAAFYDAATAGQDLRHSSPSSALMDVLPRHRAQSEARRMAAQAAQRGESWATVLGSVAYLPVAEARPQLLAATRRPAADDRATAYGLLVRNAARSGQQAAVAVLLDDLQRMRNEQEPVRSAALTALAEVPPLLFAGADAALLERIAVDAIEARDSSGRTWRALSELALTLLHAHAATGEHDLIEYALTTLARLSGHTGGVGLGRLDTALRRGQEFAVFEALRPWLDAGAERADHSLALALALGRRARGMPQLQKLLRQAIQFGNDATVAQAAGLWLDDPATRDERVARLVEREPSAAVLPPVLHVLSHRRTDLMDTVLGDTPPYGRFLVPGARWLPDTHGIDRWTPRQQSAIAKLLTGAADDASLPEQVRAGHIRAVAAVPEAGARTVRRYLDSPDTVLGEAALGALPWTDRPADALSALLTHAADDRARVALYAAARASLFVAPSRLEQVLRQALLPAHDGAPAPAAKVTSRKEFVRLGASRLPIGVAAALLAEAFDLPGQHPDVRAACVPAAVRLLRSPAAWALLEHAAEGPPVTQAAILRTGPAELRGTDRARYARLVGRVADSTDPETADTAIGLLARWSPWYPEAVPRLLAATVDLDNRTSWMAAADGLVGLTAAPGGADPLLDALTRLVASEGEVDAGTDTGAGPDTGTGPRPSVDASGDRDRPARRRIGHLVARLATAVTMRRTEARHAAVLRAVELLCADVDFVPQGVHLLAKALDLDAEPHQLLAALDQLAALHTDRPALAVRTAETLRGRLNTARRPGDPLVLLLAADRLAAGSGYAGGLFAVALTEALGPRSGWSDDWRDRLRALRRHPHPDVRYAALALATAGE
jgi:hypothetical protein